MTPVDLDECLSALRWPAETLAKALGRETYEVRAWLSGSKPIPAKTAAWIKTAAEVHLTLEMERPKGRRS